MTNKKLISPLDEVNVLIERIKVLEKEYAAAEKQIVEANAKQHAITQEMVSLRNSPGQQTSALNDVISVAFHDPDGADIQVLLKDLLYYREVLL